MFSPKRIKYSASWGDAWAKASGGSMLFRVATVIATLLVLIAIFSGVALAVAEDQQLIVQVITDKVVYQAGDSVVVEARTFLDGEPMPALIVRALVTLTLPDGRVIKSDIASDFQMVEPGLYRASGVAKAPGRREVEVKAAIKKKVTVACGCKTQVQVIKGQGFAAYEVVGVPLVVSIAAERSEFSICEKAKVTVNLNQSADIRLIMVFPSGAQRDVVIPGWLELGTHWITFKPSKFDLGSVTLKVIAFDRYGRQATAEVALTFRHGICDC